MKALLRREEHKSPYKLFLKREFNSDFVLVACKRSYGTQCNENCIELGEPVKQHDSKWKLRTCVGDLIIQSCKTETLSDKE